MKSKVLILWICVLCLHSISVGALECTDLSIELMNLSSDFQSRNTRLKHDLDLLSDELNEILSLFQSVESWKVDYALGFLHLENIDIEAINLLNPKDRERALKMVLLRKELLGPIVFNDKHLLGAMADLLENQSTVIDGKNYSEIIQLAAIRVSTLKNRVAKHRSLDLEQLAKIDGQLNVIVKDKFPAGVGPQFVEVMNPGPIDFPRDCARIPTVFRSLHRTHTYTYENMVVHLGNLTEELKVSLAPARMFDHPRQGSRLDLQTAQGLVRPLIQTLIQAQEDLEKLKEREGAQAKWLDNMLLVCLCQSGDGKLTAKSSLLAAFMGKHGGVVPELPDPQLASIDQKKTVDRRVPNLEIKNLSRIVPPLPDHLREMIREENTKPELEPAAPKPKPQLKKGFELEDKPRPVKPALLFVERSGTKNVKHQEIEKVSSLLLGNPSFYLPRSEIFPMNIVTLSDFESASEEKWDEKLGQAIQSEDSTKKLSKLGRHFGVPYLGIIYVSKISVDPEYPQRRKVTLELKVIDTYDEREVLSLQDVSGEASNDNEESAIRTAATVATKSLGNKLRDEILRLGLQKK